MFYEDVLHRADKSIVRIRHHVCWDLGGSDFELDTFLKIEREGEQRSMRAIWKKREKQIEKVLLNTTGMYGSIKGIAGNAIQSVSLLELPLEYIVDSE